MTARTPYKHKTKQYECDAAERAKHLSDTDGGRANNVVEQEKFNREMSCVHTNLFHRAVLCSYLALFIKQLNTIADVLLSNCCAYSLLICGICVQMLLFDFTHHNIEMACSLLETCGRYLYRTPDSHQRVKVYLVCCTLHDSQPYCHFK